MAYSEDYIVLSFLSPASDTRLSALGLLKCVEAGFDPLSGRSMAPLRGLLRTNIFVCVLKSLALPSPAFFPGCSQGDRLLGATCSFEILLRGRNGW